MCFVVAELSEALVSKPRGASDPSSSPIRNILVLFLTIPDEYNYFYSSGFPMNKIKIIFIRLGRFPTNKIFLIRRRRFPTNKIIFIRRESRRIATTFYIYLFRFYLDL